METSPTLALGGTRPRTALLATTGSGSGSTDRRVVFLASQPAVGASHETRTWPHHWSPNTKMSGSDKKMPARSRGRGFSRPRTNSPERRPGNQEQVSIEENVSDTRDQASDDLIQWEKFPLPPAVVPFRHHHSMLAVAGQGRTFQCYLSARNLGESEQAWESRLTVEELERYFLGKDPKTSRERERLRDEQNKAFRAIRTDIMYMENYVSRQRTPSPERPITPPGPPNRRAEESSFPLELASLEISTRGQLPIITRGVMFGNLKPIPTDPNVDPPPNSCISCWKKGHQRSRCPNPYVGYCRNCGR
ncbi:uncharacterized protein LOC122502325 [Leptopilina heterotoma]|uniref:uncharacterized protein LOC122502325 n=1 Tax=Leptopilina heterotoma TaxID=63436 RepID=UPI001CA7C4DA|nr:uncharacterized protein LOC122502325 [Leptopilina heterotoma]XP_043468246.1 uncharacterized protein LOC122502325 [Leptopilina heterotoma]XP_043468247.1 uncharacterized protein LOC122502325 [Leptopilina heterotoma]